MTQPAAKRLPTPSIDKLPEDIRTRLLAVQEKSGFIPNVFLTLAYRPDEFRAFFAYHDALMEKDGGLSKAEREAGVIVATGASIAVRDPRRLFEVYCRTLAGHRHFQQIAYQRYTIDAFDVGLAPSASESPPKSSRGISS
jgi:uncharacterized peroxidase-related enzyme